MSVNVTEIYSKISLYEETVRQTSACLETREVSREVLSMVSGALNNIERIKPRNTTWRALTPEKSSRTTA